MATDIRRGVKRRKPGSEADSQLWQRCHSGFDEEIILSEKYQGTSKLGKGKKKVEHKLSLRNTTEILPLIEKDVDIDWESSSSSDSSPQTPPTPPLNISRKEPLPQKLSHFQWLSTSLKPGAQEVSRQGSAISSSPLHKLKEDSPEKTSLWLSTCLKPASLGIQRRVFATEMHGHVWIEDSGGSQEKPAAHENVVEEGNISDYESSEAPSPSIEIPVVPKPSSPSPTVTPTQSPLIDSYGQSTQDTADRSPITSSQWVNKLKRGQQTTPEKQINQCGPSTDRVEGKDSAKKNKKFKSGGLAERLKRLINREKSDIAFWHHQSASQVESSGATCHVKITSINPVNSLSVARCQNISEPTVVGNDSLELPKELVVLFNRKTVQDENLQSGSIVHIYPPWQKLLLPMSSETVLLCTYYCKTTKNEDFNVSSPAVNFTSPNIQRPVFRPSRLFGGDKTSPKPSLNLSLLSQIKSPPVATTLLDVLATRGPSFDFEFSLQVLVLRACKMVPIRTTSLERKWRLLVQDRDRTIFEVHTTTYDGEDLKFWEGKVVNFDYLRISQRLTRVRNASLFSVIDFWTQTVPSTPGVPTEPVRPKANTPAVQSISYIVHLKETKMFSECKDKTFLRHFSYNPQKDIHLSEICQRLIELHRVSFYGLLLHATPADGLSPATSTSALENQLLFVTDPSLSGTSTSEKQHHILGKTYVLVEKLQSCLMDCAGTSTDLQRLQGTVLHLEHVLVKEGTSLLLDCYSSIRYVGLAGSSRSDSSSQPWFDPRDCCAATYPPISLDSAENTLVAVTGVMEGVDEDTAYSWPICDACKSNRLTGDDSGDKLHCLSCDRDVSSPITQIHLQILVRCPDLNETNSIKVKLKQQTIADLFGAPSSEEPFDLKRILGKPYKPTNCFIRKCKDQDADHKGFEVEEI